MPMKVEKEVCPDRTVLNTRLLQKEASKPCLSQRQTRMTVCISINRNKNLSEHINSSIRFPHCDLITFNTDLLETEIFPILRLIFHQRGVEKSCVSAPNLSNIAELY